MEDCGDIPFEIIISDNGSSDDSVAAIEKAYPSVKILCNGRNLGFAEGNNVGINAASGTYLCLINTDVVILPGCMKTLLQNFSKLPKAGMLVPQVYNGDGTLQHTILKEVTLFRTFMRIFFIDYLFPALTVYSHKKTQEVDVASGCFWLIRKEVIEKIGLLDGKFFFYGEDRDYCKRLRNAGWRIIYHTQARIIHHWGSSSKGSPYRYSLLMEIAYLHYWEKHHGRASLFFYKLLRIAYHILRVMTNSAAFILKGNNNISKIKIIRSWHSILFYCGKVPSKADPDLKQLFLFHIQ